MTTTTLALDFESFSEAQLTGARSVGIHNYMRHHSTKPLMLAFSWNDGPVEQIDFTAGDRLPSEVEDGLLDPHVLKWAYNAAFERLATRILLGIKTPIKGWRCAMALAYMRSFNGGLDDIGEQLGLEDAHLKDKRGKALIRKFSIPQIKRRKHMEVYSVCTRETDPEEWQEYLDYNRQDVVSETAIRNELLRYPLLESEWELYELDQRINDRGLPIDLQFVSQAAKMARLRKMELTMKLEEITGLANPHSQPQLLPWLQDNHYPYEEIQKATVLKALLQHKQNPFLTDSAVAALNVRQQSNRTSVAKYSAVEQRVSADMTIKHCFQFAGASRTNRWSGRAFQPQNLGRTPKFLEGQTEVASELIREGDYFGVSRIHPEVMAVLAGSVRSSIRAPERHTLVVCDLSAIESAVIAWLSGCERMLNVFRDGRDPYKDFGIELYAKAYDEITKDERTICKPAVLGCGFGLGGGGLRDCKRTGLWGYAEAMGIEISNDEAKRQVALFRETYPEIPKFWQDLDDGARKALRGKAVVVGRIKMQMRGKFLTMELPSGRLMFYHKPRFEEREFTNADGEKYTRLSFTHMGIIQGTKKWDRVLSGGPKMCLGANTLVLTSGGWKRITEVASDDKVWDGESWVVHSGVVHNGMREVISVDGVWMTEDHGVLTEEGWAYAKDVDGKARYATTLPNCCGRAWDNSVRSVVRVVREFLGRYGLDVSNRNGYRTREQLSRVFVGELRVGYANRKLQQQKNECVTGNSVGSYDGGSGGPTFGDRSNNASIPHEAGMRSVYDILNAGHNNRFVVAGETGPFIVHNCENLTQSVARDVLGAGMLNAHRARFRIVGSVHDEIITLQKIGSNFHNLDALRSCMIHNIPWADGLPLNAAGYEARTYRKD